MSDHCDVILIDLQYSPRFDSIDAIPASERIINLFHHLGPFWALFTATISPPIL